MLRRSLATRRARVTIAATALLAVTAAPIALGAGEGDPIRGGVRNPSADQSTYLTRETQIITRNDTYGTRQSNTGSGGGAIYGCRSSRGAEPCVRANNLRQGRAFEFDSNGPSAGLFRVGDSANQPFETNGTGRVENLHADRVDAMDLAPIWGRTAAGASATILRMGPLRVAVNCGEGGNPTLSANTTADFAVISSIASSLTDPAVENRVVDADFGSGQTFVMGFGTSHSGTLNYMDDQGSINADIYTQRVNGNCWVSGSAQGGPNFG